MFDPRLPKIIDGFTVGNEGVLSKGGMDAFPWFTESGYLGGTARYRLVAEEVDLRGLFETTQETQ